MSTVDQPTLSLYRKLAEVMGECGYVNKNGFNSFHKYAYVTEADLVDAVRDKLSKRNVALIPSVVDIAEREIVSDKGKHSTLTTIRVSFTFVDGDTGEVHVAEWMGAGDDGADKGIYKAYTGAIKYFLMKTFLIPTGDDPEADTKADERAASRAAPKTNGNGARVTAPPATQTERVASANQRGLINAKASEKHLEPVVLLNLVRAAIERPPVEIEPEQASAALNRILDRLPAKHVDTVLALIADADHVDLAF